MLYFRVKHNPIFTHYVYNFTLFSRDKRVKSGAGYGTSHDAWPDAAKKIFFAPPSQQYYFQNIFKIVSLGRI